MARKLRVEFEGAMYHVTMRGVARCNLFRSDSDRLRLLAKLEEGVERYEIDVFLFCLMSNHIHLILATPRGNLGQFMGWWQTAYAVYFNRKYNRSGHLTQGRYGAKLVEGDEYLLKLSRYIHLNPVQTTVMKKAPIEERLSALRAYRWSSLPGYVAARQAKSYIRYDPLLTLVAQGRNNRRLAYRQFVEHGMGLAEEEWEALQQASRIAIGGEDFIARMEQRYARLVDGHIHPEDASFRRMGHRLPPNRVLAEVAHALGVSQPELHRRRRNVWNRAIAARALVRFSGLTQREVATQLGIGTGGSVSARMGKLEEAMTSDARLRGIVAGLDERLAGQATKR